ncbi:hypothetical protein OHA44_36515 [Streptomyces sp. NBC_00144]|uniref:hypothetical protein n=1 Tax=Streptomyces sp. NBC_00144 TaxID=2975665 RepID=UPI003248FCFB
MSAAVLLAAVTALVLLTMDRPPLPLLLYSFVLLVIAIGGTGYYASRPRFLLPAFPLLLPPALALTKARPHTAAVLITTIAAISWTYGVHTLLRQHRTMNGGCWRRYNRLRMSTAWQYGGVGNEQAKHLRDHAP